MKIRTKYIMVKKVIAFILFPIFLFSCGQETESEEILFVCTHGAARSPIAAAYFNKIAAEKKLNYHAVFRGTEPDDNLTKETISGLSNDGFDVSSWETEKVSDQDIKKAHTIVTFDCEVNSENLAPSIKQWNGTPSISKDYNNARNAIKEKIAQLIEELPKK